LVALSRPLYERALVAGAGRKIGQWEATSGEKVKGIRCQIPHPENTGT